MHPGQKPRLLLDRDGELLRVTVEAVAPTPEMVARAVGTYVLSELMRGPEPVR